MVWPISPSGKTQTRSTWLELFAASGPWWTLGPRSPLLTARNPLDLVPWFVQVLAQDRAPNTQRLPVEILSIAGRPQ